MKIAYFLASMLTLAGCGIQITIPEPNSVEQTGPGQYHIVYRDVRHFHYDESQYAGQMDVYALRACPRGYTKTKNKFTHTTEASITVWDVACTE